MGRDNFQRKHGKGKSDPFDERKPRNADKFLRDKRREAKDADLRPAVVDWAARYLV